MNSWGSGYMKGKKSKDGNTTVPRILYCSDGRMVVEGEVDMNTDAERCRFLRNQILSLDSLLTQKVVTKKQYENEMRLIANEIAELEKKYEGYGYKPND